MKNHHSNEPLFSILAEEPEVEYLRQKAKTGVSTSEFDTLTAVLPLSQAEWTDILQLSERTLQRYRKEERAFDPIYSERILDIALLWRKGVEVFGNPEAFFLWINSPNVSMGGISPKSMLDSSFGIRYLRDSLIRIQHGVLA